MLGSGTFAAPRRSPSSAFCTAATLGPRTPHPRRRSLTTSPKRPAAQGYSGRDAFRAIGMFANAMGNDGMFCHSPDRRPRPHAFAIATRRIQRARQTIAMVNAINKMYFAGPAAGDLLDLPRRQRRAAQRSNFGLQGGPPIPIDRARLPH